MSCEKNRNQAGLASVANGIMGLTNRWAGTMGSWSTWMGVTNLADIGKTAADVTTGMTGVSNPVGVAYLLGDLVFWLRDQKKRRANTSPGAGAEGKEGEEKGKGETAPGSYPKIVSPIGAMIGLHTLEAATGAAGTTAMRLFMPGKPVGTWRNVVIRQDRSMPLKTKALSRVTGGRVIDSSGYYFHEGGRTWRCESYTLNVNGTARTLTRASTLAYPKREYFFDRPLTLGNSQNNGTETMGIGDDAQHRELPIQRVVDVVKGVTYPEQVPGYIGSTNELENITPLGGIKRSLFAASWFLVDESERDTGGGIGYADYQAAMSNNGNSSTHIYRRIDGSRSRTGSGSAITDYSRESLLRYDPKTDQISVGDAKGNQVPIIAMANSPSGQPVPLQAGASRSSPTKSDTDDQLYYWGRKLTYAELSGGLIKHFVEDDNGIPRPLLLRNVIRNPLDNSVIPDAIYCDGERWRQVVDPGVLGDMAQNFQNGGIQKTLHWMGFVNGYEYPPPFGASQK